jgi:hypothetical protein
MKTNGSFYILHESSSEFLIGTPLETLPIVWNRDGLYCIIPREVVENAVDNLNMWDKLTGKTTHPKVKIMWSQGIPVSNLAGRALVGE